MDIIKFTRTKENMWEVSLGESVAKETWSDPIPIDDDMGILKNHGLAISPISGCDYSIEFIDKGIAKIVYKALLQNRTDIHKNGDF